MCNRVETIVILTVFKSVLHHIHTYTGTISCGLLYMDQVPGKLFLSVAVYNNNLSSSCNLTSNRMIECKIKYFSSKSRLH